MYTQANEDQKEEPIIMPPVVSNMRHDTQSPAPMTVDQIGSGHPGSANLSEMKSNTD